MNSELDKGTSSDDVHSSLHNIKFYRRMLSKMKPLAVFTEIVTSSLNNTYVSYTYRLVGEQILQ